MNFSKFKIDKENSDYKKRIFYINKTDDKSSWPSNSALAVFAANGNKFKKFKVLTVGNNDTKVVMLK